MKDKSNKGIYFVGVLIFLAIIIGAVIISFNSSNKNDLDNSCPEGYFWTGSECCRDIDSNSVCDNDQSFFEFVFDNCPINSWNECVPPCESKCNELGLRIAVSAVDGSDLASHPGPNDKFYCNCVKR